MSPITVGAITWVAFGLVVCLAGWTAIQLAQTQDLPAADPAFRPDDGVVADEHWAGVEREWHEFVDSFPVWEEQP